MWRYRRVFQLLLSSILFLGSSPLLAGLHPYVVGGRVLVVDDLNGTYRELPVPVPVTEVFDQRGPKLLLAAEPRDVLPSTDEWGGFNLWIGDLERQHARRLTTGRNVLGAVWNDMTGRICYWTRDMELFLVAEHGRTAELIAERAASPAVSPDGMRIAYAALPPDWIPGSLPGQFDLHVLDLRTGAVQVLTSSYDDAEPVWSPDGTYLLFVSGARTGLTSIWRIRADGSGLEQLTNPGQTRVTRSFVPSFASNRDVHWAEDGSMLVYGARRLEAGDVRILRFGPGGKLLEARGVGAGHSPFRTERGTFLVARELPRGVRFVELSLEGRSAGTAITVPGRITRRGSLAAREPIAELEADGGSGPESGNIAVSGGAKYRLPLVYNPGYSAYYDNDSGGGVLDWMCASYTYDGHQGTDFLASAGSTIVAGSSGSVVARNDGCDTVGYWGSTCGGGYGNYIKLDNGDGWYSYYAHMTNGTPTTSSSVSCGQAIGLSGSSGNSTGYHLHFEVRHYGYPNDDPFAGTCSGPESFWSWQRFGYPARFCL